MSKQLSTILVTTLALLDQFQDVLSPSSTTQAADSTPKDKDALPLLSAASAALKAQVTKLSLLTITSPFTHSAVSNVLRDVNDSVLPSLVTAALLVTPSSYTKAFHSEVLVLTKTTLAEFLSLVKEVKNIFNKKEQEKKDSPTQKESELTKSEKDVVTLTTGRVWDACDAVTNLASNGVIGFVMHRVEQWRDLVRDALEEIEDWNPEEEDDFFDDLIGDDKEDDDDKEETGDSEDENEDDENTAVLQEQKKSTIRFLKPVAQIYPAIINNRLKNAGKAPLSSSSGVKKLESLMLNLHNIPDHVDEAAGALYEANVTRAAQFLEKVRTCAVQAVDSVISPWNAAEGADVQQQTDDKFTVWSRTWLKVMDEVSKSIDTAARQ